MVATEGSPGAGSNHLSMGFRNALTTRLRENHQSLNPGWLIGFLPVAGDPSVIEPLGNFGLRIGDFGML